MKNKTYFQTLPASLVFGLAAMCAHAVSLPNGVSVELPGTTSAAEPHVAGTVLVDELIPFSTANYSGSVQQRVIKSAVDGNIVFSWRIMNDANSKSSIKEFQYYDNYDKALPTYNNSGYGTTWEYDVNWRSDDAGEIAPVSAHRNTGFDLGKVVFRFYKLVNANAVGGIPPGQSSNFFFIATQEKNYVKKTRYLLGGSSALTEGWTDLFDAYRLDLPGSGISSETFENFTPVFKEGDLTVPCVDVYDTNGGKTPYQATLKYIPNQGNQLVFELADGAPVKTDKNCGASFKDGNLDLPAVDVRDAAGGITQYQAAMNLIPGLGPIRFVLTGANEDPGLSDGYNIEFNLVHWLKIASNDKYLEVEDGLFNKGKRVQQYYGYRKNGIVDGHNQDWLFLPGEVISGPNGSVKHLVRILNYGFMSYLTVNSTGQVELLPIDLAHQNLGTFWEVVPAPNGNIRLRSHLSGSFLQAPDNSNDGATMTLGGDTSSLSQQFVNIRYAYSMVPRELKNIPIVLKPTNNSNLALDVSACNTVDNTLLIVWGKELNNTCQQFVLKETYLNTYSIQPQIAPDRYVKLQDPDSLSPGANIVIGTATAPDNYWLIFDVVREPGKYLIINGKSGLAMEVWNKRSDAGATIGQYIFMNEANQKWTLEKAN